TSSLFRRTRRRIALSVTAGVLAVGLAGIGAVVAVTRLGDTPRTVPGGGGRIAPQGPLNPRIRFDGSFGDLGCAYDGPRTVPADQDVTFELTNDGEVDFFVDILLLTDGKGFRDLVEYATDPAEDPQVRPEWAVSSGVFLALPGSEASWSRTLPAGDYAVACFTTDPARLWLLTPLTADG
ncbi:MAG TPA: hypothetical protein VE669_06300, partial [Actinomycetota bacterium]|nr:hypothetical protein [Actinomycetota bacterium]